jgi:thymidylate synthase
MRIYNTLKEALNETIREVFSRGSIVFDKTVQGKEVSREEYESIEILNYSYKVLNINKNGIEELIREGKKIFGDKIDYTTLEKWSNEMINSCNNPDSWFIGNKYFEEYFNKFGLEELLDRKKFSYTYSQRINYFNQIEFLIKKLKSNPYSRGAFINIWNSEDLKNSLLGMRVPCTIGYHFYIRKEYDKDKLNLTIFQRSCDLVNFFVYDLGKAALLLLEIGKRLNIEVGYIVHHITSLHAYKKDVPKDRRW